MTKLVIEDALINGQRIACGDHVEESPVVLIRGTPSFSHIWRNIVPKLTVTGNNIYLFELLDNG